MKSRGVLNEMITNKAVREIFERDIAIAIEEMNEARQDYQHHLSGMQEAGRTVWNLEIYISEIRRILDGEKEL